MGLDLLDAPLRLTWDFPDLVIGQQGPDLCSIASSIADAGVFYVTLQKTPLRQPLLEEVLQVFSGRCQVLLSCHGHSDELERLAQLHVSVSQLLLDVGDFVTVNQVVDTERLFSVLQALRQAGYEPVLTLTPLRNNLTVLPDLVRFCSEHKVAKFKLPNANIGDSFHDYLPADLPAWQDLVSFRKEWSEFVEESCPLPAMEIHDLFLWEIMTPGQQQSRSEYGGCQAGNSLGHIDPQGVVHPCSAWPQPLGRLPDQSIEDIWAGPERLSVREYISKVPSGCSDCADVNTCFGGCRGLSFHLNRESGERDLMCSGPR